MAQLLQPKQQLAGYEIQEMVGKGGMGEVYRAKQLSMDRVVALKILAPRLVKQDPSFAKRFVEEARAAGRLNNPNIIAVHDVGKAPMPGDPTSELDYFSMEYVDGESVKDVIERQGAVPLSLVGKIMLGMASALTYAEAQGIVHRDIKPDNIMLTNTGLVKLADLGLALQLGNEEGVTERDEQGRGKVMGTPLYMSPEQARALAVDSRSDQYSLGATLFHMLTGRPPYRGENAKAIMKSHVFDPVPDPKSVVPELPEPWRQLSLRLMAKTPEERFSTCAEMRDAVTAAISGVVHGGAAGISRRVRTTNWPAGGVAAREREGQMPPWARNLVYGFGGLVVLMVILRLNWGGGHAERVEVGEAQQVEQVRAAIAVLPGDPEKASAALQKLIADPAFTAPAAQALLKDEDGRRRAALAAQQRQAASDARLAALDQLQKAIAGHNLNQARDLFGRLQAEAAALPPGGRERLDGLHAHYLTALVDLRKTYGERIAAAVKREDVDLLTGEIKASALPEDAIAALTDQGAQRIADLLKPPTPGSGPGQQPGTAANPATAAADHALWLALGERLEEIRGGGMPNMHKRISSLAKSEAPKFSTPEAQAAVAAFDDLAELALKAETAIQFYVRGRNLKCDVQFAGRSAKVEIVSITSDKVTFRDGGNEVQRDRKSTQLPLADLVDKALVEYLANQPADRPRAYAAMLWLWRAPETADALKAIAGDPIAKAVVALEANARVLDIQAPLTRRGREVTVVYDFTGHVAAQLGDFTDAASLSYTVKGLSWTTARTVKPPATEAAMPEVAWKAALLPPLTLTAQIYLRPTTAWALVGVRSGDQRLRLALGNSKPLDHKVIPVRTAEDGSYSPVKEAEKRELYFKSTDVITVEIAVAADGKATLKYNDKRVGDVFQLAPDKPLVPIFQILVPEVAPAGTTWANGIDVMRLTIDGMLGGG
jgi:hypothetical protein